MTSLRQMCFHGSFYPNESHKVIENFEYFSSIRDQHFTHKQYKIKPKAIIVPHAGYIYSGLTASLAYANVAYEPKRIIIIGPSHRIAFDGLSCAFYDAYDTPLGEIKADKEYLQFLIDHVQIQNLAAVHCEHSTEVQFPFIKHFFPNSKVLEFIYSKNAPLKRLIDVVLEDENTLLVISTDLSHFYSQDKALELDKNCIKAIEDLDSSLLQKGEACGALGVDALIQSAKDKSLKVLGLDYRTSGDINGDKSSVVGYYSALVYEDSKDEKSA